MGDIVTHLHIVRTENHIIRRRIQHPAIHRDHGSRAMRLTVIDKHRIVPTDVGRCDLNRHRLHRQASILVVDLIVVLVKRDLEKVVANTHIDLRARECHRISISLQNV